MSLNIQLDLSDEALDKVQKQISQMQQNVLQTLNTRLAVLEKTILAALSKYDLSYLEKILMATKEEVIAAIQAEAAEAAAKIQQMTDATTALQVEVQALKDQIASGTAATEEDLDNILVGVQGIINP